MDIAQPPPMFTLLAHAWATTWGHCNPWETHWHFQNFSRGSAWTYEIVDAPAFCEEQAKYFRYLAAYTPALTGYPKRPFRAFYLAKARAYARAGYYHRHWKEHPPSCLCLTAYPTSSTSAI